MVGQVADSETGIRCASGPLLRYLFAVQLASVANSDQSGRPVTGKSSASGVALVPNQHSGNSVAKAGKRVMERQACVFTTNESPPCAAALQQTGRRFRADFPVALHPISPQTRTIPSPCIAGEAMRECGLERTA